MLENKKVLIVGAGGLLGCQLVKSVIDSGATVIAADLDIHHLKGQLASKDVQLNSSRLTLYKLDITSEQDVRSFFSEDKALTGAVNCSYPRNETYGAHFFDVSLDSFNENLALHLGSTFLFNQQCAQSFKKFRSPRSVVNISSIYGVVAPDFSIYEGTGMTTPVEYSAIKSSIIHLNKYISNYIMDSDYRVNSVSPGGLFDGQDEDFVSAYRSKTGGAGMLTPENIVGAILFLLSDNSKYITGQNIIVDDGFSN